MSKQWANTVRERLMGAAHGEGGWGYSPSALPCAEPTALSCLALSAGEMETDALLRGLTVLGRLQRPDGGISVAPTVDAPCWPTGLAVLAWAHSHKAANYQSQSEKAVNWLLRTRGKTIEPNANVYGHDTTLNGWSWVDNTHSWVEPTAFAILALRETGNRGHRRVEEGMHLLLDRAIPGGGWNYGNPRVYKNTLRPFPGPTGIALTALAGQESEPHIEKGIAYLCDELQRVRSPMSLAWGLIGLSAWGRRPSEATAWLAECAERTLREAPNPMHDALLLLADLDSCPLMPRSMEVATSG